MFKVIRAYRENRAGKAIGSAKGENASLQEGEMITNCNRVIREDLSEKMTCEQRLERNKQ